MHQLADHHGRRLSAVVWGCTHACMSTMPLLYSRMRTAGIDVDLQPVFGCQISAIKFNSEQGLALAAMWHAWYTEQQYMSGFFYVQGRFVMIITDPPGSTFGVERGPCWTSFLPNDQFDQSGFLLIAITCLIRQPPKLYAYTPRSKSQPIRTPTHRLSDAVRDEAS